MVEYNILFYVYVLELEDNKFYVGKTNNPNTRLGEHVMNNELKGMGSSWTRQYKPLKVLDIIKCYDILDEDFTTIRYMKDKGIDNVRGGSFCELNLPKECIYTLEKIMTGSSDKCYYCNSIEHYINNCPEKYKMRKIKKIVKQKNVKSTDIPKNRILKYYGTTKLINNSNIFNDKINNYICSYCDKSFSNYNEKKKHEDILCEKNYKIKDLEKGIDDIIKNYSNIS